MSNIASDPKPLEDALGDGRWMNMHECFLHDAKEKEPEVLLIGDLHVQFMVNSKIWKQMFEPLHSLNFGLCEDRTENILWRVNNRELDGMTPKVIVLHAGHNNHSNTADQVADGVKAIYQAIRERQPTSYIIVMGLLPRGKNPNPLREKYSAVNAKLSQELSNQPLTTYFDVNESDFLSREEGIISRTFMSDFLHLTDEGYRKLCEPLLEEVQNLLGTFVKVESTSFDMGCGDGAHSEGTEDEK